MELEEGRNAQGVRMEKRVMKMKSALSAFDTVYHLWRFGSTWLSDDSRPERFFDESGSRAAIAELKCKVPGKV